ncbi:MAG: hypothetical protein JXR37_34200 [Kiritimatiellae bacterium]|nr:hypothetical protein [Kiritimatiellia bacterium]
MGMRNHRAAKRRMAALHAASDRLEELKACGYYAPALTPGTHTVSNGHYSVTANPSHPATKDVQVTIPYDDPFGRPNSAVRLDGSLAKALHSQ